MRGVRKNQVFVVARFVTAKVHCMTTVDAYLCVIDIGFFDSMFVNIVLNLSNMRL